MKRFMCAPITACYFGVIRRKRKLAFVQVTINELGLPVGGEACTLTRFLGTLARMSQYLPITYQDWRKVPQRLKDDIWSIVKEKFTFHPAEPEFLKDWVISDVSKKWKAWKSDLKQDYYDASKTADQMLENVVDERVDKDQLKELVKRWLDPEYQMLCEQKKNNRNKSEEPHCIGTKSFARLEHEEAKKNNGVKPTRAQLYVKSRTRRDGRIVNAKAAEVVEILKGCEASSSNGSVGVENWKNDDLSRAKGPEKRGHIRCVGRVSSGKNKAVVQVEDQQAWQATANELRENLSQTQRLLSCVVGFMKDHIPEASMSSFLNGLNMQVPSDIGSGTNLSNSEHQNSTSERRENGAE